MVSAGVGRGKRKEAQFARYVDLVNEGVGLSEAARRVGVDRKTGWRWRYALAGRAVRVSGPARAGSQPSTVGCGRPGLHAGLLTDPAVVARSGVVATPRGRYLSLDERIVIAEGVLAEVGVRQIARQLDRAPSTISREIERNSYTQTTASGREQVWARRYGPYRADRKAHARRRRPKPRKLDIDPVLHAYIQDRLNQRWSPRQIAKTLPRVFPDHPERCVTHETIYQALYLQGRGALRREVAAALRTGRARRRTRRNPETRTQRFVEPMVMISDRPAEAEDRAVPGHWEGDLIIGKDGRSAIATLVERHTRYVLLAHLPAGRDAVSVRDALIATMSTLPTHLARSLTWDQGAEMARHHEFKIATGIPVYFCDPGTPWMRGSNENTNGLLRQYFPKGTDLSVHTPQRLAEVAAELNGRPRETLNWDNPAQRLATLLINN